MIQWHGAVNYIITAHLQCTDHPVWIPEESEIKKKRSRLRWLSTLHIQCTQIWLWIYENHICERQIKKWMKAIFAIMKIIWAVDKNKAWKKLRMRFNLSPKMRSRCITLVSQKLWVQIPYRPEFFSHLIFTIVSSFHFCGDRFHPSL